MFEDIGYLMAAATVESDHQRGAQQALIAKRVEQAERLGCCAVLVSETLSMLEHPIAICGAPGSRRSSTRKSTNGTRETRAFSSEVDSGSRKENASKRETRAPF
jgi:hypothetical protein